MVAILPRCAISTHIDDADQISPWDDEVAGMAMPIISQEDGFSDYGSDFSPDQEEILNRLLHQSPEQDDCPISYPGLQLQDIEHEQGPRGARVPRRQNQQDSGPFLSPLYENTFATQLNGDNHPSANSTCRS